MLADYSIWLKDRQQHANQSHTFFSLSLILGLPHPSGHHPSGRRLPLFFFSGRHPLLGHRLHRPEPPPVGAATSDLTMALDPDTKALCNGSTLLLKMPTPLRPKLSLHSAVYRPPACSWRRNKPPPPMSNGRPPPPKGSCRPPRHPQLCLTWSTCRLRLGTRHQPPHLGHGSSECLPTGEHRAGHYVHQLCHLA
jgi:hypothetical protein